MPETDFSLYDPNQFRNMLTQQAMQPYQAPSTFDSQDAFGLNGILPPGGGYQPSQFDFVDPHNAAAKGGGFAGFMEKYGQGIGQGISAAGALFNLYGGIKSLNLMQKNFDVAKKSTILAADNSARSGNNALAHHTTATNNSADAAGVPRSGATYTPFQGWDGVPT